VTEPAAEVAAAADAGADAEVEVDGLAGLPPLPTLGAVARRPPSTGARREWESATVLGVHDETATARTLRLGLPAGSQRHVAGQHYVVRVPHPGGGTSQRSYSVASAPGEPGAGGLREIELTVERLADGAVSPYLHDRVRPGHRLQVRGPFGGWFIWHGDTAALLVGGGSGIVPLAAMVREWRRTGRRVPLRLVVSVRTPQDVYYRSELGPETTLVHTRVSPPGDPRPPGRLDAATLEPLLVPDATCFVCGSARFAEHASQLLVELGVERGRIRVERFGPS
jgi:ferredoxin-NADP reductase